MTVFIKIKNLLYNGMVNMTIEKRGRKNMTNTVEIEQLKNHLELKIGILKMKIKNGEIKDDAYELIELFKDYEKNGTTIEELKMLFEDVELALS